MKIVLVTGLKNKFDIELAKVFVREGFKVFTIGGNGIDGIINLPADPKEAATELQKETGFIDIYIDVSDERSSKDNFDVQSGIDTKIIYELYETNVTQPMFLLETFLPLLETGTGKRLCFLTSVEASINETRSTDGYGYKMAKAGLHNFLQITRNELAPKGYTFRVFDPCQNTSGNNPVKILEPEFAAEAAFNYFTRRRGMEQGDERRDDEGNLVFRDAFGTQHTW